MIVMLSHSESSISGSRRESFGLEEIQEAAPVACGSSCEVAQGRAVLDRAEQDAAEGATLAADLERVDGILMGESQSTRRP